MRFVPLPQKFYEPSAEQVAPALLGHWLVRRIRGGFLGGPIVETEAYLIGDPASHGFIGETARNRVLFGPPGRAYVYLIYGFHNCVNAVCHPVGKPEAVLIRAVEPLFGVAQMRKFRPASHETNLTNGPGKLCAAMDISRSLDSSDLCDASSPLFIASNPNQAEWVAGRGPMVTTLRIGLTKAAERPLRYYLDKSPFISRRLRSPISPRARRRSGGSPGSSRGR